MMEPEKEYIKIGRAVIDECMGRGHERCITVTLRGVQYDGKLYIRMEDNQEPLSIWGYNDLLGVKMVNMHQRARERAEALTIKIKRVKLQGEPPRVVILE
ncbi:MAG: hypothetical protein IMF19_11165 [Proteobacteria bacterium]|nr:hypothetical protein [Pseudomonadota bacterium]